MNIPKDPFMLLSFVNTKLRDEFSSLEDFCESYNVEIQDIDIKLNSVGYKYNKEENQFRA